MALGADVRCLRQRTRIPSLPTFVSLWALFIRLHPAVVHAHGAEANFHGLLAAWVARVPVRVGEEIGIPSHSAKGKWVFRQIYRTAHKVVGISRSVMTWLVVSGEVSAGKAMCVYNPVSLPKERGLSTDLGNIFRIGYVGRLEPVKNPLALLRAFEILISRGVRAELWFIGDGSQKVLLQKLIEDKDLAGSVRLLGYQSDPAEYVRQCDVYVQPSISEGFGLALVEAMGCGVPVIATSVGGAPEIVENERTGWLLSDTSAETIAGALDHAAQMGPARLREMGRCARAAVEGRFSPEVYVDQIESMYEFLASNRF